MGNIKKKKKIKEPTEYMRSHYGKLFKRNQSKWMRRSKLEVEHLGCDFNFDGEEANLVGSISSEEVVIQIKETNEYFIVHIDEVTSCILV